MKKSLTKVIVPTILLFLFLSVFQIKGYAAEIGTTVSQGINYSAVYNYEYYIAHNPDVKQAFNGDDVATLNHFIKYGMQEGRPSIETFDVQSYRRANPDLRIAYGNSLKSYFLHYLNYGKKEGRKATGVTQLLGGITKSGGIDYSAVYNYDYYIAHNPDVKQAFKDDDIATLNQFIQYGMQEGRPSIETFDVQSYRRANPDLRIAYGNSLKSYYLHYLNYGKKEGRKATGVTQLLGGITNSGGVDYSAVYNYDYYIAHNPDVKQTFKEDDIATLNQFIQYGMQEGRPSIETFDVQSYRRANPDLRIAYGNSLKSYYLHYLNYGKKEGRKATGVTRLLGAITKSGGVDYSAVYNYDYYIAHNPDVKQIFKEDDIATLNQFIKYGMQEGRHANENFNVFYYKANYPDLQIAYETNLKLYYLHYINYGYKEARNAKVLSHNVTGWCDIDGNRYYYENGSFCTGWKTISGRNYYFSSTGILKSCSGIDVSSHQGKIDWQAVKDDGIEFAIIRVGIGDDQTNQDDITAIYNMEECERLGIPYGVYLYSYALTEAQAYSEASHLLRMLKGRNPTKGVYLDVEDTAYYQKHNFDPVQNKNAINNFCKIVMNSLKNAGYRTGIYSNYNYLNNVIDLNIFDNNDLWLAYWTTTNYPTDDWYIWQYTSKGSVSGISGSVDMDIIIKQ